jgi:hypothetical protein
MLPQEERAREQAKSGEREEDKDTRPVLHPLLPRGAYLDSGSGIGKRIDQLVRGYLARRALSPSSIKFQEYRLLHEARANRITVIHHFTAESAGGRNIFCISRAWVNVNHDGFVLRELSVSQRGGTPVQIWRMSPVVPACRLRMEPVSGEQFGTVLKTVFLHVQDHAPTDRKTWNIPKGRPSVIRRGDDYFVYYYLHFENAKGEAVALQFEAWLVWSGKEPQLVEFTVEEQEGWAWRENPRVVIPPKFLTNGLSVRRFR